MGGWDNSPLFDDWFLVGDGGDLAAQAKLCFELFLAAARRCLFRLGEFVFWERRVGLKKRKGDI
jgi:hypothetical protein